MADGKVNSPLLESLHKEYEEIEKNLVIITGGTHRKILLLESDEISKKIKKEITRLEGVKTKEEEKERKEKAKREERTKCKSVNEQMFLECASNLVYLFLQRKGNCSVYVRKDLNSKELEPLGVKRELRKSDLAENINTILCTVPEWRDKLRQCYNTYVSIESKGGPKDLPHIAFWKDALTYFSLCPQLAFLDKEPVNFSNSNNVECLTYWPLSLLKKGDYPLLKEFISRIDYPDYFMAWVGGLFLDNTRNSQVLWLQGEGNDGKSVIVSKISDFLKRGGEKNPVSSSISEDSLSDKFAFSSLSNCRLLIISDTKYLSLISSPFIHKVTGGDLIASEEKYADRVQEKVQCMTIITSNFSPALDKNEPNQMRRILRIKIKPRESAEKDLEWEDSISREMPYFINDCVNTWKELSNNEVVRPTDPQYLADVGSYMEEIFNELCCKQFTFGEKFHAKNIEITKLLNTWVVQFKLKDSNIIERFDRYLKRVYNVNKVIYERPIDRKRITLYKGIMYREDVDLSEWVQDISQKISLEDEVGGIV